jgi:hypothetical protein
MTSKRSATQDVVYGNPNNDFGDGGNLVFIPKRRAEYLAAIQKAFSSSSTWREARERMPAGAYEELLEVSGLAEQPSFEEYYEEERRSRHDLSREEARAEFLALPTYLRRPELDDPFDVGDIPMVCEGDWPAWPQQEMLDWVPEAIQEQYGEVDCSPVSGPYLLFRTEDEEKLVAALLAHGYSCVRDETLVCQATTGYDDCERRRRPQETSGNETHARDP